MADTPGTTVRLNLSNTNLDLETEATANDFGDKITFIVTVESLSARRTLTLPDKADTFDSDENGGVRVIVDDYSGLLTMFPLKIVTNDSTTIDGAANYVFDIDRGSVEFFLNLTELNEWKVRKVYDPGARQHVASLEYFKDAFGDTPDSDVQAPRALWANKDGSPIIGSGQGFTGSGKGLQINPDSGVSQGLGTGIGNWSQDHRWASLFLRFNIQSRTNGQSQGIATIQNTFGSRHFDFFVNTDNQFWWDNHASGTGSVDSGETVVTEQWYELQVRTFFDGTVYISRVVLDGVEKTPAISSSGQTPSKIKSLVLGDFDDDAKVYDTYYDDVRFLIGDHDLGWIKEPVTPL